jgi:hypothetical protein
MKRIKMVADECIRASGSPCKIFVVVIATQATNSDLPIGFRLLKLPPMSFTGRIDEPADVSQMQIPETIFRI